MSVKAKVRGAVIGAYLGQGAKVRRGAAALARSLRRERPRLTFYLQVDDPISHLMAQVLPGLLQRYPDLDFQSRVVPVPAADVDPEPELRRRWLHNDASLLAARFGLRLPSPVASISPDRLHRAQAVLLRERAPLDQLQATVDVCQALWADDGDSLAAAVQRYGVIAGHEVKPALEGNYRALRKAGHYHGSAIHYGGECFWGFDRLCHLQQRLHEEGFGPAPMPLGLRSATSVAGGPDESAVFASAAENALVERSAVERSVVESSDFGDVATAVGLGGAPFPNVPASIERPVLEAWVSFRSPYAYIAGQRLGALVQARPELAVVLRPVLPMVTRGLAVPRAKRLYIVKDAKREAERHGLPFGNLCDPLGEGVEKAFALWHAAELQGRGVLAFARISRAIWAEAADLKEPKTCAALAEELGISPDGEPGWQSLAEQNRQALRERGLWGVPSFAIGDWAVWGQDRLSWALERLGSAPVVEAAQPE